VVEVRQFVKSDCGLEGAVCTVATEDDAGSSGVQESHTAHQTRLMSTVHVISCKGVNRIKRNTKQQPTSEKVLNIGWYSAFLALRVTKRRQPASPAFLKMNVGDSINRNHGLHRTFE
jgi:hypothetical protein